jgi:hypothetical protein
MLFFGLISARNFTKLEMSNIKIRWVGDMSLKCDVYEDVLAVIGELTNEHVGNVMAFVCLQRTKSSGKVPFLLNGELYLGIFSEKYGLFLSIQVLDIKDLIFMYDNNIVDFNDLDAYLYFDKLF